MEIVLILGCVNGEMIVHSTTRVPCVCALTEFSHGIKHSQFSEVSLIMFMSKITLQVFYRILRSINIDTIIFFITFPECG